MAHACQFALKERILIDRTAHHWFNSLAGVYKHFPNPQRELVDGIITRSMIIDYAVLDFVIHDPPVTVIDLGCGFSTRLYRISPMVNLWVHIDLPEVLEVRTAFQPLEDRELLIPYDLTAAHPVPFVPCDYIRLFICEGVFNHLPRDKAKVLVKELCRMAPEASLIGTAMYETALERIKDNQEGLGTTFPMWGLSDAYDLEAFLEPAQLHSTRYLGKATRDDEASGVVFMAKL
jgi:O-methyltransferase involved in polyketide biosynthesis